MSTSPHHQLLRDLAIRIRRYPGFSTAAHCTGPVDYLKITYTGPAVCSLLVSAEHDGKGWYYRWGNAWRRREPVQELPHIVDLIVRELHARSQRLQGDNRCVRPPVPSPETPQRPQPAAPG